MVTHSGAPAVLRAMFTKYAFLLDVTTMVLVS
jgi:hypothetical protein